MSDLAYAILVLGLVAITAIVILKYVLSPLGDKAYEKWSKRFRGMNSED